MKWLGVPIVCEGIRESQPIEAYCRYINRIFIFLKFSEIEAKFVSRYLEANPDPNNENLLNLQIKN